MKTYFLLPFVGIVRAEWVLPCAASGRGTEPPTEAIEEVFEPGPGATTPEEDIVIDEGWEEAEMIPVGVEEPSRRSSPAGNRMGF